MDLIRTGRRPRRDILAIATVSALLLWLLSVGSAAAKTPYFTVRTTPEQPVAGQPINVVVRTWLDGQHTQPAGFAEVKAFDGLLVFYRAQDVEGRRNGLPVTLRLVAPDEFRAEVVVPQAGDWILLAFPDRSGWGSPVVPEGYPDRIPVKVRGADAGLGLPGIGLGLVAIAVAIVLAVRRLVLLQPAGQLRR